jgi:sulfite oxidase
MASRPASLARRALLALPLLRKAGHGQENRPLSFPGKRELLVHNDFPEDLETPAEYFTSFLTPTDSFFVRQHLPRPKIDSSAWRVKVDGLVSQELSLSLDDLRKLPQHRLPATLECAGNGRSYFRPRIPGLQWSKGAVGNAEWRGPRLADVLARAGLDPKAAYVDFDGADTGVANTPNFVRSIPLRKCLHESTILALDMNGRPLPDLHGFPARLIVPGWDGASWVKWVTRITAAAGPSKEFYFATAYRYPRNPVVPGGAPRPEEMEVIEGMGVKSIFARPAAGTPDAPARLRLARLALSGVAWAGEHRVTRVEVSTDGGARWSAAALGKEDYPFAWRLWDFSWTPPAPGYYTLCVRAADSAGRTQPIEAAWNPSGYLWNSIERIGVLVEP